MPKLVFLFVFACFAIFQLSDCSFSGQNVNQNTNEVIQVNTDVANVNNLNGKKLGKIFEYHSKKNIKEFSKELGLSQLEKTARRKGFEFRLWINSGMPGDEKLLIVRSKETDNDASFYHINRLVEPTNFRKQVLESPKSGWNTLLSEMKYRLNTPKDLVPNPQYDIARHEGAIWLELANDGKYQSVYYGHHTTFEDGVRLIKLCEYLSGEFGVDIDCRGQRTRLEPIS